MKISDFIVALQAIQAEHGDLDVETSRSGQRFVHGGPSVAYRKLLLGKERKDDFWYPYGMNPIQKGVITCKV